MHVRLLREEDAGKALCLSTAAGWNQTEADWRRLIALEPEGVFGIECEGKLAATTSLLCFGTELAWVGMVLTAHDFQRRGFARRLVTAALDTAHARGVRTVKLDATDQGYDLYASLGFVDEQPVERWARPARTGSPNVRPASPEPRPIPYTLDREATGAGRRRFLDALGAPVAASPTGYVMTRPGIRASYIGPCVAKDSETAAALIDSALDGHAWFWDLFPDHKAAQLLAIEFGFQPVRHLIRMRLGPEMHHRDDLVYAIAGFEAG